MGIDGTVRSIMQIVQTLTKDSIPTDELSWIRGKKSHYLPLYLCKGDLCGIDQDLMGYLVDREALAIHVPLFDEVILLSGGGVGNIQSSQYGLHTQDQLPRGEGFYDIILCSEFQAQDTVTL